MKIQKRTILKTSVLLTLLVLFYIYYFKQVYKQFSEQLTNTAKYEEKITVTEPPTITICFDPAFKPSVFEKYNISDWVFFEEYFPNITANMSIKAQWTILQIILKIILKITSIN